MGRRQTEMSRIGRPKKEDFNSMIKVSVNKATAEALEKTAEITNKSKSDLLREIIPIVSSKDFEGMIPNTPLEILEKYSEDCWKLIHTKGCVFEVDKLSERMPAFITAITTAEPMLYVKYPTFKIQIFDGEDPKKLEKVLSGVKNISRVYQTKADYLVLNNQFKRLEFPYVSEVMCLDINLDVCIETKNTIISLLKKNNFMYSVYPAFCLRPERIVLEENKKYFHVKENEDINE